MEHRPGSQEDVIGGLIAGLIGGLAGAFVMNYVPSALQRLRSLGAELVDGDAGDERSEGGERNGDGESDSVSSTVKVAQTVSRTVRGRSIPREQQQTAGNVVHYTFGALNGALYGALAPVMPAVTLGRGLAFGAGLWVTADEALLPLLGLSRAPTHYPVSTHAMSLAGHLVYGLAVDAVSRALRAADTLTARR
jgi:hypothetical protein